MILKYTNSLIGIFRHTGLKVFVIEKFVNHVRHL